MQLANLSRMLAPLRTRIANLLARAVVQLVDDGSGVQTVQISVLAGETRDGVERLQNYGFTSVPKAGAEAAVLFVGGHRDHGLVIAVDDRRFRLKGLEAGEVALYTDEGDSVTLKRGRVVEVKAGTKLVVDAPLLELGGAAESAVKGASYVSAESTFLAALSAYAAAIKAIADPTNAATPALLSAITVFTTSGNSALSSKVKVG